MLRLRRRARAWAGGGWHSHERDARALRGEARASTTTLNERGSLTSMPTFYTFEVSLLDVKPRIWRRFTMRSTASFLDLHRAIQSACGWEDYHLFRFCHGARNGVVFAGIPDDGGFGDPDPDAADITLKRYFGDEPGRCMYQYDFGDDWWHEVQMTGALESKDRHKRVLIDGARAFPPEDCGGLYGYGRCARLATGKWTAKDGDADERREQAVWLGDWQPERFDLAAAKANFDR